MSEFSATLLNGNSLAGRKVPRGEICLRGTNIMSGSAPFLLCWLFFLPHRKEPGRRRSLFSSSASVCSGTTIFCA